MPELPDVETLKRYFDATSLHRRICDVRVRDGRILRKTAASNFKKTLLRQSFKSTHRHGKYLFASMDKEKSLVLHFGMSGSLKSFKDISLEPKYERILICFEDGFHLAILSQRLLGGAWLYDSIDSFLKDHELGPDALSIDLNTFMSILLRTRGGIKSKLMNQKLIAGIGNIYADEILFQSKIHPLADAKTLNKDDVNRIHHRMEYILQTACDRRADPSSFPSTWFMSHRSKNDRCPRCKSAISRAKAAGRSSYFCSKCQKL